MRVQEHKSVLELNVWGIKSELFWNIELMSQ